MLYTSGRPRWAHQQQFRRVLIVNLSYPQEKKKIQNNSAMTTKESPKEESEQLCYDSFTCPEESQCNECKWWPSHNGTVPRNCRTGHSFVACHAAIDLKVVTSTDEHCHTKGHECGTRSSTCTAQDAATHLKLKTQLKTQNTTFEWRPMSHANTQPLPDNDVHTLYRSHL